MWMLHICYSRIQIMLMQQPTYLPGLYCKSSWQRQRQRLRDNQASPPFTWIPDYCGASHCFFAAYIPSQQHEIHVLPNTCGNWQCIHKAKIKKNTYSHSSVFAKSHRCSSHAVGFTWPSSKNEYEISSNEYERSSLLLCNMMIMQIVAIKS